MVWGGGRGKVGGLGMRADLAFGMISVPVFGFWAPKLDQWDYPEYLRVVLCRNK